MTKKPDPKAQTKLIYELLAASIAGTTCGSFPSQEQAQAFYDATHGPLPFALGIYHDKRLVNVFTQSFLTAFKATGFEIYSVA